MDGHFKQELIMHQSLKWLRSFKEPEGQVASWLEAWQNMTSKWCTDLVGSI